MQQRRFIFNGGYSTRFHTIDVHIRQDIASHSFGVAWYCELITGGHASKNLIMAALTHDLAEHIVGDIPSPAKRALGISKMYQEFEDKHLKDASLEHYHEELTDEERNLLKFADMFEGMTFCIRERKTGNQNVEIIFERFRSYVVELLGDSSWNFELLSTLNDIAAEWEEVTNVRS